MKSLKTVLSIFLILLATTNANTQTDNKVVTITTSGSGKTQEDAKQAALRNATEQAFGAFISSKTEMFNDQVVADQMASVSSGNIKSYEVLNESQLPDGSWGVTLKTIVSVDKLTSFVEAKGIAIEIKGGMFALNIKQQLLNEQGEIKAVCEMLGLLHEPMQISFDYVIKSSDPKSLDAESKNWEIPLEVTATANKNMDFCANYCIKTLAALSLSSEEVTSYQSLNKAVFYVVINYNGVAKTIYLRKQSSINALNTLTSQWAYYTRLFTVQSGMDESNGNGKGKIHDFSYHSYNNDGITINFLTTGQQAATFSWQDIRTLSQIEQMEGYTPSNLWFFNEMPFELFSSFQTKFEWKVVYKPIFYRGKQVRTEEVRRDYVEVFASPLNGLQNYIVNIFRFTNHNGYRIAYDEANNEFWTPLISSINSKNYFLALKSISEQIYSGGMPNYLDLINSREVEKRIIEVNKPKERIYSITINPVFTEGELEKIRGFKLLK